MHSDFNSNNKSNQGALSQIIELISNIPFFVRLVIMTNVILIIANIFFPQVSFYLSNIPVLTIKQYQLWRLITTSFITTNLINMILGFIVWTKDAISLERSLGTIRYIFIFILNSIFINLISCFLTFLFSDNFQSLHYLYVHKVNNSGIWPIIICETTLLCLNNPDSKIKILFVPSPVKAKYYPFIIIILLILINNFRINFQIISGFFYGITYYFLLQNRLTISEGLTKKLERSCLFRCLIGLNGFMILHQLNHAMNSGNVNISNSFESIEISDRKNSTNIDDYMAVNDQNTIHNVESLDGIKHNSDNKI